MANVSVLRSFVEIAAAAAVDTVELQLGPKELKFQERFLISTWLLIQLGVIDACNMSVLSMCVWKGEVDMKSLKRVENR